MYIHYNIHWTSWWYQARLGPWVLLHPLSPPSWWTHLYQARLDPCVFKKWRYLMSFVTLSFSTHSKEVIDNDNELPQHYDIRRSPHFQLQKHTDTTPQQWKPLIMMSLFMYVCTIAYSSTHLNLSIKKKLVVQFFHYTDVPLYIQYSVLAKGGVSYPPFWNHPTLPPPFVLHFFLRSSSIIALKLRSMAEWDGTTRTRLRTCSANLWLKIYYFYSCVYL